MAVVWRASHLLVERAVAIKMLRPEVARLPTVPQRFLREARAAWLIDHPHAVTVLDVDVDDDGVPFIVQELLEGEDLEAHLARHGPLSPAECVRLVAPILDALAAAHAHGVVHRDLKPSNVFLARTPRGIIPKLLDFGISRIVSEDARITASGVVMGTPAYMAPEQIHSPRRTDGQADLWSFGAMCFELLSGVLPFDGESSGELLVKICTAEPRALRDFAPAVPVALEQAVMSCLRRSPSARPPSAAALLRELRALEACGELTAVPRDVPCATTAVGLRHGRSQSEFEALLEEVARRSLRPAVPANDVPANEASPSVAHRTLPDGSAMPTLRGTPSVDVPPRPHPPRSAPRPRWLLGALALLAAGLAGAWLLRLAAFSSRAGASTSSRGGEVARTTPPRSPIAAPVTRAPAPSSVTEPSEPAPGAAPAAPARGPRSRGSRDEPDAPRAPSSDGPRGRRAGSSSPRATPAARRRSAEGTARPHRLRYTTEY